MIFKNLSNNSDIALVIDWQFHKKKKWVSIFAPYLVEAFIKAFDPLIITSQFEYELFKKRIRCVLSMEPGWAAPKLRYDTRLDHKVFVMASDPHNKKDWFQSYIIGNNIRYVLSQYNDPFFYHFPNFPQDRFVHFPWAVPDCFLSDKQLVARNNDVVIFGAQHSPAYDVRNWCRNQTGVVSFDNSGVENRKFTDEEYFIWLSSFDAVIAAGSSDPQYDLVTPKYFEIPASGALLVGQHCSDLVKLGFNDENTLIFEKHDFIEKIESYRKDVEKYLNVRQRGLDLIRNYHCISHRITLIHQLYSTGSEL